MGVGADVGRHCRALLHADVGEHHLRPVGGEQASFRLSLAPCSCGRTHVRMERISGRTDDMLIIRGVNVFPSQIESVLIAVEGVEPHYQLIVTREGALDVLEVQVEVNEAIFSDEVKGLEGLARRVEHDIKDLLGVSCKVKLVEPKTIQRSEGKAKRVIDQRKI
jgi:phenylacetate-CoA ligase